MSEQHETPIKTPRQLIIIVVLAFVVPITLILLLSQLVTSRDQGLQENQNAVLARIKAVGEVTIAAPSGPKGQATGEAVYNQVCKTCHEGGLAGAPKVGDDAAWAKVIAQGQATTVGHAVSGIRGMPAKGGNPDLENVEVERAAVFMANKSGAKWKDPPAAAVATERTGEQVVAAACGKCHQTGVGGAPKIGDRAAWTPRVAKGLATVTESALKGHGGMPARGGMAELSDVEVKRAIEYMFNSGTGAAATAAAAPAAPAAAPAIPAAAPAIPAAAPATPAAAPATPAAAPATPTAAPATPTAAPAAPAATAAAAPDGRKTYDGICAVCHAAGIAGAPKFGDKAVWAPRLKTGMPALYAASINGKGAMPPKGGNAALSDAEVKAAVDYLAAAAR